MSKILLIKSSYSRHHRNLPTNGPPIGLMYLASYWQRRNRGREIKIVDMVLEQKPPEWIDEVVREFRPDICGISCMTVGANNALRVAAEIKRWDPRCHVIFGGPHIAFNPEKMLESGVADYCVIGEGEHSGEELISALEQGAPPVNIKGIGFRNGEKVCLNNTPHLAPIDTIPWPAYNLIPVELYHRSTLMTQVNIRKFPEYMPLMSSRGCPYQCIFCHNIFGKRFRVRDPEDFVGEMEMLRQDYGVREFHIIDDVFNLQRERTLKICDLIRRRLPGVALAFPNGLRGDLLDSEVLTALKDAGMYNFSIAIESGSAEIQRLIKKKLDLDRAFHVIKEAVGMGILVHGFFMMGFPGETEEQLKMTIDFARKSALTTATFFSVTVYPRTEIYEMARMRGVVFHDNLELYNYHNIFLNLTGVNISRLKSLRREAYRRFYFDPHRIWRIYNTVPRKIDIWRNFKLQLINFF